MSLRSTPDTFSFDQWRQVTNSLGIDVGDLHSLSLPARSSIVDAVNFLDSRIDTLVLGKLQLTNNTFFPAENADGSGTVDIFRATPDNKIEFGTPITAINIESGTILSLTQPLGIDSGGTGATDAATARTSLGLKIGVDVQAASPVLTNLAGLDTGTANDFIVSDGSKWGRRTPTDVVTTLGLTIGSNVQAWSTNLDRFSSLNPNGDVFLVGQNGKWEIQNPQYIRETVLGVTISALRGGAPSNETPTVQRYSPALQQIGSLTVSGSDSSNLMGVDGAGTTWTKLTPANARAAIGLKLAGVDSSPSVMNYLTPAVNNFIIGVAGPAWKSGTQAEARVALGLGTLAFINSTGVNSTIGPLTIASGTTYGGLGTIITQDSSNVNIAGKIVAGAGSSIPSGYVTGLGSMASQPSGGVTITGGTISCSDLTFTNVLNFPGKTGGWGAFNPAVGNRAEVRAIDPTALPCDVGMNVTASSLNVIGRAINTLLQELIRGKILTGSYGV